MVDARQLKQEQSLRALMTVKGKALERVDARLAILQALRSFLRESHLGKSRGRKQFAALYNEGQAEVEPWVRASVPRLSLRTLERWSPAIERDGVAGLVAGYGKSLGTGVVDRHPDVQDFIIAMLVDHPNTSAKNVMRGLRARFGNKANIERPAYRTVQRFMATWREENAQVHLAITNPDRWRSKYQSATGNASESITAINQLWELDSSPADVMLADGRFSVIGGIDIYSRRMMIHVTPTSRATAIAALLRRAMIAWGVPLAVRVDCGADYKSDHITRVLAQLEIEHIITPPFTPEDKPFIERAFGTFTRDLVELHPGFIGHDVAGRKDIEARRSFAQRLGKKGEIVEVLATAEEFQRFCDEWCENVYAHDPHKGLSGSTPFEIAAASRSAVRRIDDERALDVLLTEAPGDGGVRMVGKKGVSVESAFFDAAELGPLTGQRVAVRFDQTDLGRIYVFDTDGAFVCIAVCPERAGISRQELAAKKTAAQKEFIQRERKALKEVTRSVNTKGIVGEILADSADRARSLVAFPPPAELHGTPALDAAAEAAEVRSEADSPRPGLTDEERAAAAARFAELSSQTDNVVLLAANGERPIFDDDKSWALWVIDNPEKADDDEKDRLIEKLRSVNFRLLLSLSEDAAKYHAAILRQRNPLRAVADE